MPFTKRAPRLIKSRAADTHRYEACSAAFGHIASWRALSRPQTQNSLHFFAGWIQRDANTCATIFLRSPAALAAGGAVGPRWQSQAQEAPDEPRFLLPWYPDRRLASATHGDPFQQELPRNPTQDAPPAADSRRGRGSGAHRGARVGDEARWSGGRPQRPRRLRARRRRREA